MRCLRLADVPAAARDRVFRSSPARALFAAVAAICGSGVLVLLGWHQRSVVPYYLAGVLLLGLVILQTFVLARFRPSNWLVQVNDEGLFVQFRSYLNYRFPSDDLTVVFIPYQEILSARPLLGPRTIPDSDSRTGMTEQRLRLVELELTGDSAPLVKALTNEFGRCDPERSHGGWSARPARYHHHPVRMVSPTTLQLEWDVVPRREVLLDVLRPYSAIGPAGERSQDYQNLEGLSREEQEKRIMDLVETGNTFAAIYVARKLYSYDLTQGRAFVENLRRKQPTTKNGEARPPHL